MSERYADEMKAGRRMADEGDAAEWQERPAMARATRKQAPAARMTRSTRILLGVCAVLALISLATGVALFTGAFPARNVAQAQSQPAPGPDAAPSNPAANGPAANGPAANSPAANGTANPAAQQPQPKVTRQETFEDWIFTCVENPADKATRCAIAQQLSQADSGRGIFLWRITQNGEGGLAGIWQTPDGLLLSRGITLDAGTPQPITIPYQTCGNGICQAVAGLAPDFVETLTKAEKATATVYRLDGRGVTLTLSVKGLARGLAELAK